MQTPTTTDDGPGGRDPQVRACVGCGADNTPSAAFCWRCYRPLDRASAPWPAPPLPLASAQGPQRRIGRAAGIAAAVVGAAVIAWFIGLRGPELDFPEAVSDLQRISTAQTEAAADSFRAASEADGLDADMAFYGGGSAPEAALMWIRGTDGGSAGPTEAFDAFAQGFTGGYNGTLETSERTDRMVDGVTYLCAPISGALGAGICMWEDGDVTWVLLDVRPGARIGETNDLAVSVHDAVA